ERAARDKPQEILRRQTLDSVTADIVPPKAWLDAVNQFQNEERNIEYMALGPTQDGNISQPTEEQLKKYFDKRKIIFRASEYRKVAGVSVTPSDLAKWMEVSDEDLKKAYEQRRASLITPERRHVEQIVFPTRADAQAAADRIKTG